MEKLAVEHVVLDGLKKYIEDVIEDSDTLADEFTVINNDIYENKQNTEDNHRYVMEHINDEYERLSDNFENDIDTLRGEIEELKEIIQELQK